MLLHGVHSLIKPLFMMISDNAEAPNICPSILNKSVGIELARYIEMGRMRSSFAYVEYKHIYYFVRNYYLDIIS